MGVIYISILLGGFAQDNVGALLATDNVSSSLMQNNGFSVSASGILISNPYGGIVFVAEPRFAVRLSSLSLSLGYLFSPSNLNGIPLSLSASWVFRPLERFCVRPRVSVLGPSVFFPEDIYSTYRLNLTGAAGVDAVYDPFKGAVVRPVGSLGATAGYAWGAIYSSATDHEEPLDGFGYAGSATLGLVYSASRMSASLEARASYGGRFIPQVTVSILW
ncbi:hypothetical protein GX441_07740 [bacterium]|nr:hypothetical protein [bacterium]